MADATEVGAKRTSSNGSNGSNGGNRSNGGNGSNGKAVRLLSPTLERHQSVMLFEDDLAVAIVQSDLDSLLDQVPDSAGQKKLSSNLHGFKDLFQSYLKERKLGNKINWEKIRPLPSDAVIPYADILPCDVTRAKELLKKLVVVKLNGGLGTSMGCVGPKSLIQVRNDSTFLDLTIQQIEHLNKVYDADVPLVLMNSFNTKAEMDRVKHKYERLVSLHMFEQSCYPRINQETLRPLPETPEIADEEWYPPGHGDIYTSLKRCGLLEMFMKEGKEVIFISNIDNLGATVDTTILNHLLQDKNCEFVMEVTNKTRSDVKGGTLIQYENKVQLLEIAQVPKDKVDEFKSISKFKVFNTNNLWVKLSAIDRLVTNGGMKMDVIVNKKATSKGTNVIQLETAAGAAIKNFKGAVGVNVPRKRFLPVKKTSDLLVVMSNLFMISEGSLQVNVKRSIAALPLVKLGDKHFQKVRDFLQRFDNVPDMLELDHLTVSGDVTFGKDVVLKGTVIIIANHGDRIDIPSGAYLENKIVSGNLRILDH